MDVGLLNFVREMVLNLFFIFLVLLVWGSGCRSVVVIRKKRPVVRTAAGHFWCDRR